MTNQKAIERIKKLLRLASKTTSQGEAANALSQAQKLMAKHGINTGSPELSDVSRAFAKSQQQPVKLPAYIGKLTNIICSAFGCRAIRSNSETEKICTVFIGHDERPVIAQYAYEVLERQLLKARKEYLGTLNKRLKKSTKVARADLFCAAWVMAVHEKVKAFALTDEEKAQIEQYMQLKHPNLTTSKVRNIDTGKARGGDTAAILAGHAAGKSIELNHGVNGSESPKLTVNN